MNEAFAGTQFHYSGLQIWSLIDFEGAGAHPERSEDVLATVSFK
jgi:hypothetical protein